MSKTRVGELRPSQILYTFGVGAIVDLPNLSVLVMGLDEWETQYATPIEEERLLGAVREELGVQVKELRQAPIPSDQDSLANPLDDNNKIGIPVMPFPGWVLCPSCRLLAPLNEAIFQLKEDQYYPEKTRYVHTNCNRKFPPTVIPARFLVACSKGHLDDFPWRFFIHKGVTECNGSIRLREFGVSGTASDVLAICDGCDKKRSMAEAFGETRTGLLPRCRGRHPHLRSYDTEACREELKGILLGASNSWFSVALSAFSIPKSSNKLAQLVDKNWLALQNATALPTFKAIYSALRAVGQLAEFEKYQDEEIWQQIENKRNDVVVEEGVGDLKTPEWEIFVAADRSKNSPDFELNPVAAPAGFQQYFEKVVLVEKLREVRALIGFTRIESPHDSLEMGEVPDRAPISRQDPKWVPASEIRGEGIFIQFSEAAIAKWESSPLFDQYIRKNQEALINWRQARGLPSLVIHPGVRFILLHSFSHALMRQLAIECGYAAASLRERIYSKAPHEEHGPMAGVLIYTAAPDSEGTLGGLVNLGKPENLARHIEEALQEMLLCASDPLCAEHDPLKGTVSLHWAACHACLFSPETSCERGNKYLDRALLKPSVKVSDLAFFK